MIFGRMEPRLALAYLLIALLLGAAVLFGIKLAEKRRKRRDMMRGRRKY